MDAAQTFRDQCSEILKGIKRTPWQKIARSLLVFLGFVGAALIVAYLWGMIFYSGPFAQAGFLNALLGLAWIGLIVFLIWKIEWVLKKSIAFVIAALIVVVPYSLIKPSNDRDWHPDFRQTGYSEQNGDAITLHNVRNFDYPKDGDVVERWESRTVRLSNLRGLDLFHDTFMGDLMGHPILSFDFGPDGRVCVSVETRRENGEKFTPFGGMYKMFELQYLFATEEDCIRLRTNIRKEPVYLYQIEATPDEIKAMFLSSVAIQNELAKEPRFYNVISANCTTSLRAQRPKGQRGAWDHRILFNGLLDEYLYEQGWLKSDGLSFESLREKSQINAAAEAAHSEKHFSHAIRQPRPNK